MKKNYSPWIILLSTILSVITMSSYSGYISNRAQYKEGQIVKQRLSESSNDLIDVPNNANYIDDIVVKNEDEETPYIKENLEIDDLAQKKVSSDIKSEDENSSGILDTSLPNVNIQKNYWEKYIYNDRYVTEEWDSLENYNYDKENEQTEQTVFKVQTGQIIENLTTSDKIKLLYISIKLGKEDYKMVEKHLYAEDAEDGVLKALKLLKENLTEKEYEKVRIIAGKFINMEAAEKLY